MKAISRFLALLAVAASALVSCKGELTTPEEKPQTGKFEYTFTLGAPETKALLASDSEGYFAQWEVGDKLGIYTLNNASETTNNTAADIDISKNPVEFKVVTSYALDERSEVYAYFPYDANNSTEAEEDPSAVVLSIPASQTGSLNAMPMAAKPYAVTEPISVGTKPIADIKMRNLGSILNFNVFSSVEAYRAETVSSIAFTTETPLCGSFTYDIMAAELSDITGYEGTTVTVTKNITPGNDKASGNTVPMVVAPNATAGYTGTIVVTTNVATYTYTISSPIRIDRSIIKKVNVDLGSSNAVREALDGSFFYETFGVPTGNTNVTDFSGWSETGVTYSGSARVGITSSNICSLEGSSAQGYMYASSATIKEFNVEGINTSKYDIVSLSLNYKGSNTSAKWKIEYSTDGSNYTAIGTDVSCKTTWQTYKPTISLPSCVNLRLKITNTSTNYGVFFDDLKLYGENAKQVTSVVVSGTPNKLEYFAGETFNPGGLTVIANFDDSSNKNVTSEVTWTDESGNPLGALTAGTTSVTVKAVYKNVPSQSHIVSGLSVSENTKKMTEIHHFTAGGWSSGYATYTGKTGSYTGETMTWTITFGGNSYSLGSNKTNISKCVLGSTYEKLGTPLSYTSSTTYVTAVLSESKMDALSKVVFNCSSVTGTINEVSLVYSTDNTNFTKIETLTTKDTDGNYVFTFDEIASAYYAIVIKGTASSNVFRIDGSKIVYSGLRY